VSKGRVVEFALGLLDRAAKCLPQREAAHLATGRLGEDAAYFHLRKMGYVMAARNWRTVSRRGELDMVGWDGETLCFIEVKTRGTRSLVPAELAVDDAKREELREMARVYSRQLPVSTKKRFDVVSVYVEGGKPDVELIRDAFGWK
jgi:putative endonuclease